MELVAVQREGSVVVVVPTMKRLDAAVAPAFKQEVVRLIESGDTRLLLDMGGVQFLDSSGLGAIVSILKALGNRGTLAVCNVQGAVLSLFQLTRMDRVFALHPTREDAMARLGA
jgi:anti-sigma B factor antagonist